MTANLKPVDFKAVAAKGAFVYCYLREDGTPYYVGFAGKGRYMRPTEHHETAPLPKYDALIRVLRSGLTAEDAFAWEIFYIKRFGRKIDGGVLVNRSSGGEASAKGAHYTRSAEDVAAMAARNTGRKQTAKTRAAMSAAQQKICAEGRGWMQTSEGRAKVSAQFKGTKQLADHVAARQAARLATVNAQMAERYQMPVETYAALSRNQKQALANGNYTSWADYQKRTTTAGMGRVISSAKKYGIDPDFYCSLAQVVRQKIAGRFCRGLRGAELLAGIA